MMEVVKTLLYGLQDAVISLERGDDDRALVTLEATLNEAFHELARVPEARENITKWLLDTSKPLRPPT